MSALLRSFLRSGKAKATWLVLLASCLIATSMARPVFAAEAIVTAGTAAPAHEKVQFFEPFTSSKFDTMEKTSLIVVLVIAIIGLLYAWMLMKQVLAAPKGTKKMQEIAAAVREGANAYLGAQARKIIPLIFVITFLLYFTANQPAFAWGRAAAFFVGAFFSWTVGFVGMYLATEGNLRVATAARQSYGEAMQLGYRTGTVAGMLTDGLGLLGGTCIFLIYGEKAYEALLGFGFGGTLLALFMRVGGGIYTKAADVGADLVGKIEAGIPEDDPRNAATIADNVGDNVGDCAGMASDIFESYEVTIVAAMILGMASYGHKGVIFPLLVRGIGVLGSIISTYTVKAGPNDTSDTALHSVHRGFWIGSVISVIGFVTLGLFYLKFDANYFTNYKQALAGFHLVNGVTEGWYIVAGADIRPILTCFIGIVLAVSLNKLTSYYTHTSHPPVKSLARACQTGHATNIIQGLAIGYESAVMATLVLAASIALSVFCFEGTTPVFIAYGVAMAGIGMLTLTGNTISMDVFGPVADNANGIGEMGYEEKEMGAANYKRARQILADLDAVGNTTKAETKGIAIGSAVIAAVSMFASFIATLAMGSEEKIVDMNPAQYLEYAGKLTVAEPKVLIGMLIGGCVPWLFSAMLIRAVGRAAFYIIKECRIQFRDKEIWAGTKKPNYGRVVDICTSSAQSELIGPAILGVLSPILVGILLGPYALGGFLAGMIVSGIMLGVFMANSGGAWDNAKKSIEDEPRDLARNTGKGSEKHKAAVTGDTVGDPLKDTAGPAINPMLKVMNMVAMLTLTSLTLNFNMAGIKNTLTGAEPNWKIGAVIAVVIIALIVWAVRNSNKETAEMMELESELGGAPATAEAPATK
jgi:K(+)-stimulated pyrophosphate-energized sodium pump